MGSPLTGLPFFIPFPHAAAYPVNNIGYGAKNGPEIPNYI
ncbi:hypothetical phage protein [Burkholderia cenocepacia J2315]|uniref:Hypothetical phage protein n=1 Tax=Burkholderia cenocepacia (strain ATCC BAA-245 / DSM 16553 / LMG 16656 / NCTC 13227 / J2315 / CF5610) TaxID=216591 RepID=B4EMG0_BURCJ|nr:hypothetical phage protein [Burkholderia cenocepacia J2315]